jgi:hypothetical protein
MNTIKSTSDNMTVIRPVFLCRDRTLVVMRGHRRWLEPGTRSSSLRSPEALRASAHPGNDRG